MDGGETGRDFPKETEDKVQKTGLPPIYPPPSHPHFPIPKFHLPIFTSSPLHLFTIASMISMTCRPTMAEQGLGPSF